MKLLERPFCTAFGATTILFLNVLMALASPTHAMSYHLSGPISAVLVPVLLNFLVVWLLLTLLFHWRNGVSRLDAWLWSTLAILLLWKVVQTSFSLNESLHMPHSANLAFAIMLFSAPIAALAPPSRIGPLRLAKELFVKFLGLVAVSGILLLTEALVFAWQARHLNTPRPLHQSAVIETTGAQRGRIIWLVLDELSYRQLYGHRYAGLELPNFDRLSGEATIFTHTVPAGRFTEMVLPSLITGRQVDKVRVSAQGWPLEIHNPQTQTWQELDPHNTVFQDALNAGYSTAVAGVYIPYCRILPDVLDHCYWISGGGISGGIFSDQSIIWNSTQPALHYLRTFAELLHLTRPSNSISAETALHQQDYYDLLAAGDKLLADPSVNFLLLHMPIPHPGGIYNRHTNSFVTTQPSYLDNLVLCDLYLAHLRQRLEQNGSWDNTTLVVMGDHSWRVSFIWSRSAGWTQEEQIASDGGQFDERPGYIVKLPHQTTSARIDIPFAALHTRELFDNLLAHRITTPSQLANWAQQRGRTAF